MNGLTPRRWRKSLKIYNPDAPVLTGALTFTTMKVSFCRTAVLCLFTLTAATAGRAWDFEGHQLINQLAVNSLPANFPGFVRTPAARERIGFLGGEADRWRNTPDLELRHGNGPDHFFDLDLLEPYQLDLVRVIC